MHPAPWTYFSLNFIFFQQNLSNTLGDTPGLPVSCKNVLPKKKCRTCRTFGRTFWKDIGKTFSVNLMACASDLWIKFNYSACSVRFSNCFFHFLPFFYFKFQLKKKLNLDFFVKDSIFPIFISVDLCQIKAFRIQVFHF